MLKSGAPTGSTACAALNAAQNMTLANKVAREIMVASRFLPVE